jgi:hypothetical protein
MADSKRQLPSNVAGKWFADEMHINRDASRQSAPDVLAEVGQYCPSGLLQARVRRMAEKEGVV